MISYTYILTYNNILYIIYDSKYITHNNISCILRRTLECSAIFQVVFLLELGSKSIWRVPLDRFRPPESKQNSEHIPKYRLRLKCPNTIL